MNDFVINKLDWDKVDGLMPVVIQDSITLNVLMLGYMNQDALKTTLETQLVTFFSRTKNRLWTKGETSGNFLKFEKIIPDCDNDTLLIMAKPTGEVCHKGMPTCFGNAQSSPWNFLSELETLISHRFDQRDDKSYTAELFDAGISRIAQKVGEEGVEVALAAVTEPKEKITSESADLLYHLLVLLKQVDLTLSDVIAELAQRHK